MADAARAAKGSAEEPTRASKAKQVAAEIGYMMLSTFLTGVALGAGNHAWTAAARKFGGRPPASVVPLKRVV